MDDPDEGQEENASGPTGADDTAAREETPPGGDGDSLDPGGDGDGPEADDTADGAAPRSDPGASINGGDGDTTPRSDPESSTNGGDDTAADGSDGGVGRGSRPSEDRESPTDTGASTGDDDASAPGESGETRPEDVGIDYEAWTEGFEHTTPEPASAGGTDASAGGEGGDETGDAGTDADADTGNGGGAEAGGTASPAEPEPGPGPETPTSPGSEGDLDLDLDLQGPDPGGDAPPDDEEMPLSAHIEEMVRRLAVVVVAAALATAFAFPAATRLLNAMWYGVLPTDVPPPTLYGPLEKILSEVKVASLAGILAALPVIVYEAYLFMRPGLYPKERRYFLAAVPTSLVLGSIGMAFAYFLVLPFLFQYFITYSESAVDALPFGLRVTFDLIVSLLGAFALVFQIPLLIMLAVMIGVVSRRWLEEQRLLFHGLFLGIGFFVSLGDATGTAPLIIAATMGLLFEGTLALLRWTGRN